MPALLFGSISTVCDTSERQRGAFNQAFADHGLEWKWERDEYRELLTGNGGRDRVSAFAEQRGSSVDADAIHRTKSEIFRSQLAQAHLRPRPGVLEVVQAARDASWRIALVTTTSRDNITAVLAAVGAVLPEDTFDLITDVSCVDEPKPSAAVYQFALGQLGVGAADAVAVEDNVGGVKAAQGAGIACIAFPNENTVLHDFGDAPVSHHLEFAEIDRARSAG